MAADASTPSRLDFVSADGSGMYSAGTVTWNVRTAPAKMAAPACFDLAVTVNATATPGGDVVNAASIDSDASDPIGAADRAARRAHTRALDVARVLPSLPPVP